MQARLQGDSKDVNIPRVQRRPPAPALAVIKAEHTDRNAAMVAAYQTGEYSYHWIAKHFGVHFTTVGRIMRAAMRLNPEIKSLFDFRHEDFELIGYQHHPAIPAPMAV